MSTILNPFDKKDRESSSLLQRIIIMLMWIGIIMISVLSVAWFINWFSKLSVHKKAIVVMIMALVLMAADQFNTWWNAPTTALDRALIEASKRHMAN
jgi:hypothetical protein